MKTMVPVASTRNGTTGANGVDDHANPKPLRDDESQVQSDMSESESSEAAHTNGQAGTDSKGPNSWQGTFVGGKDNYALTRDCNANTRLTAQHYLWKDLLGFLVHPDIPTSSPDLRVADVATGNGIWLQDLAATKPLSCEFHGFDISLDQVGPKAWLPANTRMHTWDVFTEPPAQFCGYFDIVHVRLITVVVKNNDPRPVLENLRKLLKHGGYLQWDEVDTIGSRIKAVPGSSAKNLDALFSQLRGRDTWKYQLTQILDDSGYRDSMVYSYEYCLGIARLWSDVYVSTWKEFAENALKTPEVSRALELKAMAETRNGAAILVPKLVWVTRKDGGCSD